MELLRGMIMTACDVAAITKPWKVQKRVATMVASEFFEQGDLERKNLQVEPMVREHFNIANSSTSLPLSHSHSLQAMMDRKKRHELPKMQVNFIDFICMPLYKSFANLVPDLQSLQARVEENRKNWQLLADDPRGWKLLSLLIYMPVSVVVICSNHRRRLLIRDHHATTK